MLRLCQRITHFSLVTNKIAFTPKDYYNNPTLNFFPVVGLKNIKLGSILLNQPNNQNFFTVEMMDELYRFLTSYTHDHTIQNVWIQNKGSMFMGGISYKQLHQNPDYLDKLYKLTALFAQFNKPTFSCAQGGVRNVGAYILSMSTVALTDYSASLRIDQVSKGFIPVAGGTHRLSRLPAKLGVYLALTGRKLDSTQMSRLGFITGIRKQQVSSKDINHVISRSNLFFRDKLNLRYLDQHESQWSEQNRIVGKQKRLQSQLQVAQVQILQGQDNLFAKFAMNQYKLAQINYQNAKNPYNSFSSRPGRTINNYFLMRHQKAFKSLERQGFVQKSHFQDLRLPGFQINKILKVFGQDNLLDAIKLLENDLSQWAKQTLAEIRKMDPLAAIITFQMLKRAENLSWDQCLDMQYTAAKRILTGSTLSLKQTYGGSKFVFQNKYSSSKIQDLQIQNILQEYLSPALNQQQKLELDVPSHSLLPASDYVDIPDSARLALNRQFFNDVHIGNQERQFKRWLQQQRIDYRNKSFNIDSLRQKILNRKQYQMIQSLERKRIQYLLNNSLTLQNYLKQKFDFIDKIKNQQLQQIIKQTTKIVFNQGIKQRFQQFNKTANIIGKQKKLQIFKNLRKILIKNVVIHGIDIQAENQSYNQTFKGIVYFNKQGKGILQTKNPNLKLDSNLQSLSQQIGNNLNIDSTFSSQKGLQPKQPDINLLYRQNKSQQIMNRAKDRIQKRYYEQPYAWDRAYQYEVLVKQAAKTSTDLANYLQWDTTAYYNTILNSPQSLKTYNQFGQQVIQKIKNERQQQKQALLNNAFMSMNLTLSYFQNLYSTNPTIHKSIQNIKSLMLNFEQQKQMEKFLTPIFQQILRYFDQKYNIQGLKDKKLQFGQFDQFIYQSNDKDFVSFYKNDILFVYSYFTILKIKDILHNFKISGISQKKQDIHSFFRQYGIQFLPDRNVQFVNKVMSNLLFKLLDIHTYTKAKIQLPQNKLLDFLNRVKINRQTAKRSAYPLSFESLLLMIGKDRTKLYNKVLHQYIPTQPQYLLQISKKFSKNFEQQLQGKTSQAALYNLAQNTPSSQYKLQKNLIGGFQYYLGLFDSFIHRASGKYNFINDQILSYNKQQIKKQLGNILNLKQSNQQWFDRVIRVIINQILKTRVQFQKNLTKGELYAFDQQFKQLFSPQTFRLIIKFYVHSQIQSSKHLFGKTRHYNYQRNQSDLNQQQYCRIRKDVKNPDAFKRLNNLRMAMQVQQQYFITSDKKLVSQQQKIDLVQQKKQFGTYQRFPKQTYSRIVTQTFDYGQQKNFDKYLNPIKDRQMNHKKHSKNLTFIEDQNALLLKKQEKFTQFQDQLKQLKNNISKNNNGTQIDSIYSKIQQLL